MSNEFDEYDTDTDLELFDQLDTCEQLAKVLLRYLDALALVARESRDEEAIQMLTDLQDEVKPQLRWFLKYGTWR